MTTEGHPAFLKVVMDEENNLEDVQTIIELLDCLYLNFNFFYIDFLCAAYP